MTKPAVLGGEPIRTAPWPKWPIHAEQEEQALLRVLHSGDWWHFSYGQGVDLADDEAQPESEVARFQRAFARYQGCKYGIAAANGAITLEIALRAAGVRPGDEVIIPAYTFVATATAPLIVGAIPIFVDIDPDTYNIDPRRVAEAITPRTRAIVPVHFGGQPCDMDALLALAKQHDLVVIEDAAHAHGASYRGRMCGSMGDLGSFSFQVSKNMTAGEGGMITTNNREYADICESLVWGGRKKGRAWYHHYILAGNARMTEWQGAILSEQLARLPEQTARRSKNGQRLDELLSRIEGIRPTRLLDSTTCHSYHLYMFRYDPKAFAGLPKAKFVRALQAEGIAGASAGYMTPLYANPVFTEKNFLGGGFPVDAFEHGRALNYADFIERCPVSERACEFEAVWLPQTMLLAEKEDMDDIARAIWKVQENAEMLARSQW